MQNSLVSELQAVVGRSAVLTRPGPMRRYLRGYRFGAGQARAVVLPDSLVALWRVLQVCVRQGVVVIAQAANTGLTGGSTPFGDDYDREVVVIGTRRLKGLQLLGQGRQVVALPGATLDELEKALKPLGREPHSVIGSSCLGASVIGGICNNSGGSLIRRGPAYTELALFAQLNDAGQLELVNHLGIELGDAPEEILSRLERGTYDDSVVTWPIDKAASDPDYTRHVRDIEADTPARYNADPGRLYEAAGSAGRVMVFAVRLDTFEQERDTQVFYIGTNDPAELTWIRRSLLANPAPLPIAAEYLHRGAFDIAERYGKDIFLLVRRLGTQRLPALFTCKSRLDALAERLPGVPANLSDRLMQWASGLFGSHLPARLLAFRDRFEHHLMIKAAGEGIPVLRALLSERYPGGSGDYFQCSTEEGAAAFLHRFATAGAAVRYAAVHPQRCAGVVALDIALARNDQDWFEQLPQEIEHRIEHKLYYGHFFCHVFHQDYLLSAGASWQEVKAELLALLNQRGAHYPAEHNVGHLYPAAPAMVDHYRTLDPCNCFNPGIGKTSKRAHWH